MEQKKFVENLKYIDSDKGTHFWKKQLSSKYL